MNRKKTQIKKAKNPARSVHIPTTRCVSLNAKYVHFDNTHIENVCHACFGIGCASGMVREWEHECESRLKIKDLCSIVFYVRLVKWSFFCDFFYHFVHGVCSRYPSLCARHPVDVQLALLILSLRCHVAYRHLLFAMFFDIFHLNYSFAKHL